MTPDAQERAAIRGVLYDRLHLVKIDGTMWATNTYWIVKAERVEPLLRWWNLEPHQGLYEVGEKLTRLSCESTIVTEKASVHVVRPKSAVVLTPRVLPGTKMHMTARRDDPLSDLLVMDCGTSVTVALAADFVDFAAPSWQTLEYVFEQSKGNPLGPVVVSLSGVVVAAIMPVRYQ